MSIIDRIEVYRSETGWRWRAKARNNETVGSGEEYHNRIDLLESVHSMYEGVPIVQLDEDSSGAESPASQ